MTLRLDDLLAMKSDDLHAIVARGAPLDLDALADAAHALWQRAQRLEGRA